MIAKSGPVVDKKSGKLVIVTSVQVADMEKGQVLDEENQAVDAENG